MSEPAAGDVTSERDVLLAAKLNLPGSRPDLEPRPRLAQRLDEGQGRGLVLACAPAGHSKTVLLAERVWRGRHPVAGLSLDAGDDDPARFWQHAVAFGSPGGDVILQAMLQGFLNVTVSGMAAQQAVEAPRSAAFAWPDSFYPHLEVPARTSLEGRFGDEVRAGLRRRGHDVVNRPDYEFGVGGLAIAMDAAPRTGTGCWRPAPTPAGSVVPSADKCRYRMTGGS
jgi:hypothetical protein